MHYIATALFYDKIVSQYSAVVINILLSPSINVSVRFAVQNLVRNAPKRIYLWLCYAFWDCVATLINPISSEFFKQQLSKSQNIMYESF